MVLCDAVVCIGPPFVLLLSLLLFLLLLLSTMEQCVMASWSAAHFDGCVDACVECVNGLVAAAVVFVVADDDDALRRRLVGVSKVKEAYY
jgi:hypothetical protein